MKRALLVVLAIFALMLAGCAQPEPPAVPAPVPEPAPEPAPEPEPAPVVEPVEGAPGGGPAQVGEWAAEKDDGVLRSIGCNLETNTIYFNAYNPTEKTVQIYEKVVPSQNNPVKFSLSGITLLEMDCGGATEIAPGESVDCSKSGVKFRSKTRVLEDRLAVVMIGNNDALSFRCLNGNVEGETTEASAADVGAGKVIVGEGSIGSIDDAEGMKDAE